MFEGMSNISGLLKQAMNVKGKIEDLKESLGNESIDASAGGGMVTVVMNGRFEVLSLQIDPEVIDKDDPEMLETLVRAAINEATRKTQDLVKERMTEITGGIEIPGLTA